MPALMKVDLPVPRTAGVETGEAHSTPVTHLARWAAGLALIIFGADLTMPAGVATGILYLAPILLGVVTGRRGAALALTALCVGLLALAPLLEPSGPDAVVVANTILCALVLGLSAWLGLRYRTAVVSVLSRDELQQANRRLKEEISARKDIEEALRLNQQRFSAAQEIAVVGSWEWDVVNDAVSWSDELFRICGLSPRDSMTYERFLAVLHPADRDAVLTALQKTRDAGTPFRARCRIVRPDGTIRFLEARGQGERDAARRVVRVEGTGQDITDLRETAEALERSRQQLRALSAHLQSVRELEQTRIAREIHDELGQALTALKLDLGSLARRATQDAAVQDKVRSMVRLVNDTIQTVRRIATDLRPAILDDLGLSAALEWQTQEFQRRTGMACVLKLDADLKLTPEASTGLFRVFQETLTNVARHARASAVTISFGQQDRHIVLEVRDNGVGIREQEMSDLRSLGITGMRERVALLGGELHLTGVPGRGTTVLIQVPADRVELPH